MPPVAKTAVHSTTLWISRDTNVAVRGVECLKARFTEAFEQAKAKAVSRAKSCADMDPKWRRKSKDEARPPRQLAIVGQHEPDHLR
jgi:hypothetical protein